MAYVCAEWFPNKEHPERSGFFMDDFLKREIDIYLRNVRNAKNARNARTHARTLPNNIIGML